jgi:hypothetical protein
MMQVEAKAEHRWLERLVGEWETEMEASMAPGQPPTKHRGTETVRSMGGLWLLCEGLPSGGTGTTLMTLGYDPARGRFVGTFIGSMMTNMWVYDGALDASGSKLVLDTVGPSMTDPAKSAKYQDIVEYKSNNERVLSSQVQNDDGTWQPFMSTTYRRKQ